MHGLYSWKVRDWDLVGPLSTNTYDSYTSRTWCLPFASHIICVRTQPHPIMQHDYQAQIAHHYRMDKLHDYILTHYRQLCFPLLRYMLGVMMHRLLAHMPTCLSELCHYAITWAAVFTAAGRCRASLLQFEPLTQSHYWRTRYRHVIGSVHVRPSAQATAGTLRPLVARPP